MYVFLSSVALVVAVCLLVIRNRNFVRAQCALRRRILSRDRVTVIKFNAARRLLEFAISPEIVGFTYDDNAEVAKMFQRAQTGGGFCPFTFRDKSGMLVTYLFHVRPDNGGVVGWGVADIRQSNHLGARPRPRKKKSCGL